MIFRIKFPGDREAQEVECDFTSSTVPIRPLSGPPQDQEAHHPVVPGYRLHPLLDGSFLATLDV